MNNVSTGNNVTRRMEALMKRGSAVKEALRQEKARQKEQQQKEQEKLFRILGAALVQNAAKHPDFELMLKGILQTAVTAQGERNLLAAKGWL